MIQINQGSHQIDCCEQDDSYSGFLIKAQKREGYQNSYHAVNQHIKEYTYPQKLDHKLRWIEV